MSRAHKPHTRPPGPWRRFQGADLTREEEQRAIAEAIAAGRLTVCPRAGSVPATAYVRHAVRHGRNTESA